MFLMQLPRSLCPISVFQLEFCRTRYVFRSRKQTSIYENKQNLVNWRIHNYNWLVYTLRLIFVFVFPSNFGLINIYTIFLFLFDTLGKGRNTEAIPSHWWSLKPKKKKIDAIKNDENKSLKICECFYKHNRG